MFAALFCTLVVKFFHAWRYDLTSEYFGWILADISVLLAVELVLSIICFRCPSKWVTRSATIVAAVVCTWSVMNAGWLIRTGTQILPRVLLPVVRAPVNSLCIVGVNLAKMPIAAVILLAPSALALGFFFFALARPSLRLRVRKRFIALSILSVVVILSAVIARPVVAKRGSSQVTSVGLRYNSQLRAVMSLVLPSYRRIPEPRREVPSSDQVEISLSPGGRIEQNVVLVILEGIQHRYTSLADGKCDLTPYLASLAEEGMEFANTRSSLTHTTKALFALLSGRFPSASQDIAEAVPVRKPYASIATILRDKFNYRTAFFQSAMGSFESRPGLVHNLGYDKFWARDDCPDPNSFVGYLACDEFAMLGPIADWIKTCREPFFLTVLCSVTHDPYEVPAWFGTEAKEPLERYQEAIFYTDKFLAALDVELARLNLTDKTILCVVGDHGEAFGEHGLLGHERIGFEEVLRIPFCIRAPFLLEAGRKVTCPVSSVDLAPTLLGLLGFQAETGGFDGVDVLGPVPEERKVYFSGWMQEGPAGFVMGNRKFIYNPTDKTACMYDLAADPMERERVELPDGQSQQVAQDIISWREGTVFRLNQQKAGKTVLYDHWLCRWTNRVSSAKRRKEDR
ncbi:MAG: LTA synthase family protein [Planctomycetota bacterium]